MANHQDNHPAKKRFRISQIQAEQLAFETYKEQGHTIEEALNFVAKFRENLKIALNQ